MYNIRKKLWMLMMLMFAVSLVIMPFSGKEAEETVMASSDNTETDGIAEETPLWSGPAEKFVAHRGYSGYAPENSIPAFELAGRMGFWGIETDISETADGAFVCMHDDTIDRTTNGEGTVGDYSLEQLDSFQIDSGNYLRTSENLKIPTLEEYLGICREYGCVAVVEIKSVLNYESFLSVIDKNNMTGRCIITGGNIEDIRAVRALNNDIPVMLIGYYPAPYMDALNAVAEFADNRGVLYNFSQVDAAAVETLRGQNVLCGVWSIDEISDARAYLDYGVDFIVTNEIPARLTHMVNENE